MQQQPSCRLVLPGSGRELLLPLPVADLSALRSAAEQHFKNELAGQVRRRCQRNATCCSSGGWWWRQSKARLAGCAGCFLS